MKIYYEINENLTPDLNFMLDKIAEIFPQEIQTALKQYFDATEKIKYDYMVTTYEKIKYKVMWALRSLESEINHEEGIIIINERMQIETKEFSEELTSKIHETLKLNLK